MLSRPHLGKKSFAPRPWLEALQPGATVVARNENSLGKADIMKTMVVKKVTGRLIITNFDRFSRATGCSLSHNYQNYWAIDKELTEQRKALTLVDVVA